jgi:hypothetical protein
MATPTTANTWVIWRMSPVLVPLTPEQGPIFLPGLCPRAVVTSFREAPAPTGHVLVCSERFLRVELVALPSYPPKGLEDNLPVMLVMLRDDWWWPWWVSTLIDLGVVAIAFAVFVASRRRAIRLIAATFALAGLVAAIMAPIVMSDDSNERMDRMERDNGPTMTP